MNLRALVFTLTLLGSLGCNQSIRNFVSAVRPPSSGPGRAPDAVYLGGPMFVRSGAGVVDAVNGPIRMRASVVGGGSGTQLYTMGSDRRARLTLGRTAAAF